MERRAFTSAARRVVANGSLILFTLMPAGCASAGAGDAARTAARATVDVRLDIRVPTWGEFGLASTEFDMPRALTRMERRLVRLRIADPSSDQIVAAAASVSPNGRRITVVAAMVRRRGSGPVRRHGLMLEGAASLADAAEVLGGRGLLIDGILFFRASRSKPRRSPDRAVASPGGTAPGAADENRCPRIDPALRHALRPVFLSGGSGVNLPTAHILNGNPFVSNATPAGLVLDQTLGLACRPPFRSPWLVALAGWRGPQDR